MEPLTDVALIAEKYGRTEVKGCMGDSVIFCDIVRGSLNNAA